MHISEIAVVGGFGVFLSVVGAAFMAHAGNRRHGERMQRLKVLETALQHPTLDDETRRQLLQVLTREEGSGLWKWLVSPSTWGKLWFGVGWLMFIIAGGGLLLDMAGIVRINEAAAGSSALLGLAMLSLPLGLRELRRRDLAEQR